MVHLRVQLHVRGQAGPEVRAGTRDEAERELALEHQDRDAAQRAVREQAEDERRGDLVGRVGDADVEVGQLGFDEVADDDLEFALLGPGGANVRACRENEEGEVRTYFPWTRFVNSAAMRGSISTAVTCFACSRMRTVKLPVPGPTSSTLSVGRRFAYKLIELISYGREKGKGGVERIQESRSCLMASTPGITGG